MSNKKTLTPRQRGTPSPGSQQSSRISPHRLNPTTARPTSSSSHRRTGSGSRPARQPYARAHDEFLSNSSMYPADREDNEVLSIYRDSLDPRERSRIENLVNQQKKDAGFTSSGSGVASSLSASSSAGFSAASRKVQRNVASFGSLKPSVTQQPVIVLGSEADNLSDTPTEVESYNVSNKLADSGMQSPRARPGAQRAIVEMASQLSNDEVMEVMALLALRLNAPAETTSRSSQQRRSPRVAQQHSQHTRRSKSGPPMLSHGTFCNMPNDEDLEIQAHNADKEDHHIRPALGMRTTTPHMKIRSSSTGSNFSTTPVSRSNTPAMTPVDNAMKSKSPIPVISNYYGNGDSRSFCPAVYRDDNASPSNGANVPTATVPVAGELTSVPTTGSDKSVTKKSNFPYIPPLEFPLRSSSYPESIHSPRSAFDDISSVGSNSSAFTESSRRSSVGMGGVTRGVTVG